jgi:hypothetical protein
VLVVIELSWRGQNDGMIFLAGLISVCARSLEWLSSLFESHTVFTPSFKLNKRLEDEKPKQARLVQKLKTNEGPYCKWLPFP